MVLVGLGGLDDVSLMAMFAVKMFFAVKTFTPMLGELTDLPHIRVVWVIFGRHQQQHHAFSQLDTVEGHNPHVEKNAKQHSDGDLP